MTSQDLIETQSLACATWESRSEGGGAVAFSMFQKCKSCTVENNVTVIRLSDGPPRAHRLLLRDSSSNTSAWETRSLPLVTLNKDWNMRLLLHTSRSFYKVCMKRCCQLGLLLQSCYNVFQSKKGMRNGRCVSEWSQVVVEICDVKWGKLVQRRRKLLYLINDDEDIWFLH